MKVMAGLAAAAAALALAGCGGADSKPGNQAVYDRIAAESDCAAVQHEFDVSLRNHDRDLNRGRVDLAEIDTSYSQAAEDRLEALGCA